MKLIQVVAMILLFPLFAHAQDCEPPQVAADNLFPRKSVHPVQSENLLVANLIFARLATRTNRGFLT